MDGAALKQSFNSKAVEMSRMICTHVISSPIFSGENRTGDIISMVVSPYIVYSNPTTMFKTGEFISFISDNKFYPIAYTDYCSTVR